MPIYARKTIRLGIVRLNFTQAGFSSYSVRLWPWSWNSRTRRHSIDLPGPWSWRSKPRPPWTARKRAQVGAVTVAAVLAALCMAVPLVAGLVT